MALTPFDGELDAPVSGLAPFTGKLDGEPEGIAGGLRAATESGKAIAGDIGTGLNIGTTVDIPEQVIGINALARAMTPAGILSGMVTPQAAKDVRGKIEGVAREAIDSRRNNLSSEFSPEQQAANKKQFFTDDASWKNLTSDGILSAPGKAIDLASKGELFGEGWSDWRKPVGSAVQSAPSSLLMMTPTALASKTAAQTAIKEAAAAGLAADAAQAAGVKAAERTAMIAGGLSEGAQGAGSAYEQTRRTVLEMPEEKLRSSPFYQEQLAANGGDAKAARAKAAEAAALTSASGAFWFDALFGAIGDKYIGTAAAGKGTRTGALARGAAQETPTEFIQSGGEKLTENLAMKRFADPSQDLMQNVGEEATGGALSGAIMGAGMGAAFHRSAGIAAPGSAPPATPALLPDTGPISRSANIAIQTGAANLAAAAQAADVLGAPPVENNDTLNNQPAETGPVAPNIGPLDTAAAAADPVRAQQTDAANIPTNQGTNVQSSAANQDMQNRDRTRAASVVQMQKIAQNPDYELASIARDSNGAPMVGNNGAVAPAAVGKKERVTLPDGTKINTNYAVVEADSLSPSHFADGTANAGYGKDGKLTALNNGRTAGLMQAYNIGTAGNYRAALEEDTDGHGIPREVIAGMKAPVLVRLYDPASVDQSNLGARSNQASALGLGTSEQANSDAAMIDSMDGLNPDDSGDFATSRDFIRRFMSRLPQTEQAGMVDADGALSQSGYARVRNAILAKAYGESPVLLRMVESLDDNMRNVTKALVKVAPQVAKARAAIADGAMFDADITPDLLAAVAELSQLKSSGRSINDALAQEALFGGYSNEVRDLLQFLGDNLRRPNKIADFIGEAFDALAAAGSPNQGSMFGESRAPTKSELLSSAKRRTSEQEGSSLFAGDEKAGRQAGTKLSRAPGNAQGNAENAAEAQNEWVAFPPETGTLGIPRADMPQVKGTDRGALIQFLDGRDIQHKTIDVAADQLHPTQAEFSTQKAAKWGEIRDGVDRSVLISSDGYVLDGHHQWIAALATKDPIKAIVFSAPIDKLLAEVLQFPSITQSDGAKSDAGRVRARQDFDVALAELGSIIRQINPGVRMLTPEEKTRLMPTLVKLFESGIKTVGYNIKDLIADVKKAMRASADEFVRKHWNKIDEKTYKDAAAKAVENVLSSQASSPVQQDLFAAPPAKQETPVGETMDLFGAIAAAAPSLKSIAGNNASGGQAGRQSTPTTTANQPQGAENGQGQKTEVLTEAGAASMSVAPVQPPKVASEGGKPVPTQAKLGKRATEALAIMQEGGYWRKALETSFIGGEKFETRLRYANGGIATGVGFKTFTEMQDAGLLQRREVPKSTVYAEEWGLREKPLAQAAKPEAAPAIPAGWKLAENGKEYTDEHGFVRGLKMSERERAVEQSFYDAIRTDTDGMIQRYLDGFINPDKDGLLVDPDRVKELSEDFKNDRAFAHAVHEPSSHLSKLIFSRLVKDNIDKPVVFTAGGGGSGKTEAMPVAYTVSNIDRGGVVVDSTLSAFNSAKKKIDEVLAAGGEVSIIYTNAPVEKAFSFAMKRPRVVRMVTLAQAHQGASDTIRALSEHYKDNPKVSVVIVNNLGEIKDMHVGTIDDVPHYDYNEVERRLYGIAEQALKDGTINQERFDAIFRGYGRLGGEVSVGEAGGMGNANDLGGIQEVRGDAGRNPEGGLNEHAKPGESSPEGKEPGAVPGSANPRGTGNVRDGNGGRDSQQNRVDGSGNAPREQVGQVGPGDAGAEPQGGRRDGKGNRPGRNAGVPAGRDIPVKSGKNYAFGDSDLTYEGSWLVKARQNVEAVELLKSLEADGRQATREEQATLAKFIGWGASDLANSIFGNKLDAQAKALSDYEEAIENLGNKDYLTNSNFNAFRPAFNVLKAKNDALNWYTIGNITRAMLDASKPDASVKRWIDLRNRVKSAMTREEWDEASRSTQYAHYTSKPIVKAMWSALERMGFKGGTILEPGAGIGVFPGLMSRGMAANSIYTGIEFDSITGGILKQLFPDERILVESFIDSKLPAGFYDVAAGNPPFNNTAILADPKYKKFAFALHDYFFAKSIDSVKPGGLVMFVTSRYTMDKLNDKARAYLAERADLVGAIRLPQTAFKKNAGTDVVTDVLFLRKKVDGETFEQAQPWAKSVPMTINGRSFPVNEYFHAHPEMVLGKHSDAGKMANSPDPQYTVEAIVGDIDALFEKAAANLPADIYKAERGSAAEAAAVREIDFNPKAQKEGNYYITPAGVLMQREGGIGLRVEKNNKDVEVLKDFVSLRDALKQSHYDQLNSLPNETGWEDSLAALRQTYDAFVKKHGRVNQFTETRRTVEAEDEETGEKFQDERVSRRLPLISKIQDDPDYSLVMALEKVNDDTGEITDSPFLSGRVLGKPEKQEIRTASDALLAVLNDTGKVDIPAIAERMGIEQQEAIDSLGSLIYQDPSSTWQMADEYLSGNVKKKLRAAQEAAKSDSRYVRNVEALMAVQPAPVPASDITVSIGMNWIPAETYEQFLEEKTGVSAKVHYNERTGQWAVEAKYGDSTLQATQDWGTKRRSADEILLAALTGAPIRVTETQRSGGETKTVFLADATEAANQKLAQMRQAFSEWIWQDAARADALLQVYNDKFNTIVPRKFDGSHLTLPGKSQKWNVFDHVKRGAWRIIQAGNTYLAHAVGSGKTFQMIISAMEQKRLGLIQKPMMVVPNHMLKQFAAEWVDLYPAARLMVADEKNFHTENRRRFVSRVAMSDLDGVIITHSAFKLLDLDPEFKQKMIGQELDYLRAALKEAGGEEGGDKKKKSRDPKVKQIESKIEKMEQKLEAAMSDVGKDKNVRFDQLGVDMLYVDEAHDFRKLAFTTQRQVKGIDSSGSDRAFDLWMKTRWLEEKNPGRSLVMASGTPVTNTLAELFSVQRFMAPDALEERGLDEFDAWASMFGQENTEIESDASGKYAPVTRFSKFVNVPELTQMFREFSDVLTSEHLAGLLKTRPTVKGGTRKIVTTPQTAEYSEYKAALASRLDKSRAWKPTPEEPNNPDPVIKIIGDGRLAAIDMRFVNPSAPSDPDSKLNRMADEVIRVYKETADRQFPTSNKEGAAVEDIKGATQVVFSDLGFGAGVAANRGFNARAWFEKRLRDAGIPPKHVAFMADNKKSVDKLRLFKDVNAGRVRIVVGSSKNMGTGVNMQQRLAALHHLDTPWFPADLEQREGRIVRQGNKHAFDAIGLPVELYAYSTKGSYDAVMWQMLASKQRFIDQALSGDSSVRSIDDLSESSQFQIATAMTSDDPRAMQLAGVRAEVEKLQRLSRSHENNRARMRMEYQWAGSTIEMNERNLPEAIKAAEKVVDLSGENFRGKVGDTVFDSRKEFGEALLTRFKEFTDKLGEKKVKVGEVSGFDIAVDGRVVMGRGYLSALVIETPEAAILAGDSSADPVGVAMRATSAVSAVSRQPAKMQKIIEEAKNKRAALEPRIAAVFPMAEMLADKAKEANDLEITMLADQNKLTGREREQQLEDEWQKKTGAITPLFSRRAQTETPEFKAWFGDSKVVDADGKPLVVYHGTNADFTRFSDRMLGRNVDGNASSESYAQTAKVGFWFNTNPMGEAPGKVGAGYTVDMPVYLSIKNPYREMSLDWLAQGLESTKGRTYRRRLIAEGYDGIVLRDEEFGGESWIAFRPEQIKSSTGNNGQFDPNNPNINMSRGTGAGMVLRDLQAVADRAAKGLKNLPRVHVLESPATLSTKDENQKSLRDYIRKAGAWEDVEGATHNGEIYLFASGLADEARAEHVLATHEVTHYGLRGAIGKDLDAALQVVWMNNAAVRKAAAALKVRNGLRSNVEATEEVLADMRAADLVKLSGWRRVVKSVRDWLARIGASKLAARVDAWLKSGLDDQQQADLFVADLVTAARDWVKSGKGRPTMYGTLLADGTLAEDVAKQEKWLTAEARARGYKSIDELAEKNYKAFENLAKLWREKNPADVLLSRAGVQSRHGLPNQPANGTELQALRRAAARLERPRNAVFLRVTEDGRAIATGPKGVRVPETFIRFAQEHDLAFEARRNGEGRSNPTGMPSSFISSKSEAMPAKYRESGAMYFGEGNVFFDRTGKTRFSRNQQAPSQTAAERADKIIQVPVAAWRPVDTIMRTLTHAVRIDALTSGAYDRVARLLDRYTPEAIKAGVISDYGIPEAVLDERTAMQGRMRVQLRKSGELLDKMATLTRAESRVAYEWMNNADPQALSYFEAQLPPESVKVMEEIKAMIDALSQEAVALKQLDPEAFKRNRFEYLRRSYVKHTAELTKGEMDSLRRAIAILGDQYKGRGMTDAVDMAKFKNVAPEWWGRKLQEGKADKGLKGERFIRLERRAPTGEGVMALETAQGPGDTNRQKKGRLLEVAYWPAGEAIPVKYSTWDQSGTWEVVDAKGGELIVWRDFTKQERISMGEIDEARYAIAKTLHSMIHDIETGRYLEWLATTYAKKPGESIDGKVVEASERMRDVFKPGEWVKVPETKVAGTSVAKYGLLAGRYLPGPIWNDVRQTVGFRFKPLGETYAAILGAWKTSKTALSPAVHTNNVMANFVMADWHDVTAGHIVKALRIILGASQRDGRGAIGRTGNVVSRAGIADAEAAREIINRFLDSGANLGSWVTAELQKEQLEPLLKALENEVGTVGQTMAGQVGAMVAVQKALQLRFPSAWDAFKPTRAGQVLTTEAKNMIDLYEAEDQVFRLAAWLRAKEGGSTDALAGKVARRSFLDYHINAPWIQAMRSSALPFISFTYRAVPMMLEVAAKKPHKIMKLALAAAAINALGYLLSGGDEDDERRLLPEEKAGRVWGLVPKLVRMPWNDANNSPVFLDIRRFVPVGDVFDIGQNHAALPLLPVVIPGGPLAVVAELVANRSQFTGRAITLETDTPAEQAEKVADHIYKAFAPNIVILPGTYAWTGVSNAASGRTDSFGREQSPAQATASAFGVKLGSYPKDVLQLNAQRAAQAKIMEIDRNITQLKREYQHNGIDSNAFEQRVESQQNKKRAVLDRLQERMGGN